MAGDAADDLIDQIIDSGGWGDLYPGPRLLRCDRCRADGLTWLKHKGAWALASARTFKLHQCPKVRPTDFDIVED